MSKDIPTKTLNLAKRLQSLAEQYDGLSIIKVTFVANSAGHPVFWTRPSVIPLEPRLEMSITALEEKLGPEDLQKLLYLIAHYAD